MNHKSRFHDNHCRILKRLYRLEKQTKIVIQWLNNFKKETKIRIYFNYASTKKCLVYKIQNPSLGL
jgi:hypothetical protein